MAVEATGESAAFMPQEFNVLLGIITNHPRIRTLNLELEMERCIQDFCLLKCYTCNTAYE